MTTNITPEQHALALEAMRAYQFNKHKIKGEDERPELRQALNAVLGRKGYYRDDHICFAKGEIVEITGERLPEVCGSFFILTDCAVSEVSCGYVEAYGNTAITSVSGGEVWALGNSTITEVSGGSVEAHNNSTIEEVSGGEVLAYDNTAITSVSGGEVEALGNSTIKEVTKLGKVRAHGNSKVLHREPEEPVYDGSVSGDEVKLNETIKS